MTMLIRDIQERDLANGFLNSLDSLRSESSFISATQAHCIFSKVYKNPDYIIAVAEEANRRIVGTATLLIEQKFIHNGGIVGHIEDVAVDDSFQKGGIGTSIVKYLLERAKSRGCYKTILDCDDSLMNFYENIGFSRNSNCMRFDHC